MSDKHLRPHQRILINADDQMVTLSLASTGDGAYISQLKRYIDDGRLVRCPECDRCLDDSVPLNTNEDLWTCHHCKVRFVVQLMTVNEVYDQEKDPPVLPLPNMYERSSNMSRQVLYGAGATAVIEQAKAWISYGMLEASREALVEFDANFTKKYGSLV